MEFIGTILEIFKCVRAPVCKYVKYHRKLDEMMKNLKRRLQELNSRKEDIEETLTAECGLWKKPKNEVSNWLQIIQKINSETQDIEKEVNKGRYLSRARLGKLVEEKIQQVEEYLQKGSFPSVVIDVPPPSGLLLPTKTIAGVRNKEIVEKIWEHLMSDKVGKIGVYGMGGVGKTTIVTHINNEVQTETNKFNHVIWVTVSQTFDLIKLQSDIANALNENLPRDEDKITRAGRLLQILKNKNRFVLILDDVWEAFSLEDVGIPEPTEDNGCKLVITTRSRDICRSMGCAEVRVQPLTKKEALNLFLDKVERNILEAPTLKEIVESVVERCAGLPLAIVTVAGSMRGVEEIHEWRNALNELSRHLRSITGMDTDVYGRLEFSYNRLKDERVQHCFLYCALYPEDFEISKDELIDYWIAEGYFDEMDAVQAKYDRGHTILNRLVNCCLLERADDGRGVKMHDLIRDMALRITSKSPLFMVKAGAKLEEFPSEQEWKENLEKVSLMRNEISEIPSELSPTCPSLSTLLLQQNLELKKIPECFFVHMHGLKILDLSFTDIEDLPDSVSDLINLRSLLLRYCGRLHRVPSLAKLLALQNLDLGETEIGRVPEGLGMLKNLRYLNLYSLKLQKLQTGYFPNLHRLFKLRVYWGSKTLLETVEEAAKLSDQLDTFEGLFTKLDDFNIYVKSLGSGGPKSYRLILRMEFFFFVQFEHHFTSKPEMDKMVGICFSKIGESEDSIVLPKDVQCLRMKYVGGIISLNNVLSRDQGRYGTFSSLKEIVIEDCSNLKKLFSPDQLLSALQNLERLRVSVCSKLEEIIAFNVDEEERRKKELGTNTITFTLPRLRKLELWGLRSLKSVCCDNAVMVCNSLQEIKINECSKLRRLSLSLPQLDNGEPSPIPALKAIQIEREIWESLEWHQPNAKNVLYPYCNFTPRSRWPRIIW